MIRRFLARRRFMREHRWTQAHLSEYLDAELGGAETARVDQHIELCPQCRRVLATLRRTVEALRSLAPTRSTGTADAVIQHLRKEDRGLGSGRDAGT